MSESSVEPKFSQQKKILLSHAELQRDALDVLARVFERVLCCGLLWENKSRCKRLLEVKQNGWTGENGR